MNLIFKIIKKLLTIIILLLILLITIIRVVDCNFSGYPYNPKGKQWYYTVSLAHISNPFIEEYDDSCTIKIDKYGNVEFKTINGEVLKGNLITSYNLLESRRRVTFKFENGYEVIGLCYKLNGECVLSFSYGSKRYKFTNKKSLSKEEVDNYRDQLVDFISDVYKTGEFPTLQEIKNNNSYKQFTNLHQIDPHHHGSFRYDSVKKVIIENIEYKPIDEGYPDESTDIEITIKLNGESSVFRLEVETIILITKDKKFEELEVDDLRCGDCLVHYYDYYNSKVSGYIDLIYCFEE